MQWSMDTDDEDEEQPFFLDNNKTEKEAEKLPFAADNDDNKADKKLPMDNEIQADAPSSSSGKSMMTALPTSWSTTGASR